nr:DUF2318 domain-containing protein [Acidobacteriota bacterium]
DMSRFKPSHGILLVLLFVGVVVAAELALDGRLGAAGYQQVLPDANGTVKIELAGLKPRQVRFFRFLNRGNQEVKFFVGRDAAGQIQVAFDADETCAKAKRGFRHEGEWVVCNKCDKSFRLAEVSAGNGGCWPVPLAHRVEGDVLLLAEADVLKGWRYFR